MDDGSENRVVFQLGWPGLMARSISVIRNADHLTPKRKHDIFHFNAGRRTGTGGNDRRL